MEVNVGVLMLVIEVCFTGCLVNVSFGYFLLGMLIPVT